MAFPAAIGPDGKVAEVYDGCVERTIPQPSIAIATLYYIVYYVTLLAGKKPFTDQMSSRL